jgi:O-antigen ligase
MKDRTASILRIFLAVLLVISAVLFVIFYIQGEDFTTTVMTWAYILLAITVVITIVFPIAFFISNPKKGKSVLIGLIGFVALYFIAYSISTGNITGDVYEKFDITETTSRFIGAILYATYILGGLAILSILYAGISSLFK